MYTLEEFEAAQLADEVYEPVIKKVLTFVDLHKKGLITNEELLTTLLFTLMDEADSLLKNNTKPFPTNSTPAVEVMR